MKPQEATIETIAQRLGIDIERAKKAKLKGLWKGLKISERDIKEAKHSWTD